MDRAAMIRFPRANQLVLLKKNTKTELCAKFRMQLFHCHRQLITSKESVAHQMTIVPTEGVEEFVGELKKEVNHHLAISA